MDARILIIGSGSLARAVSYSLALRLSRPHRVVLCARSEEQLAEITYVARTIAASWQAAVSFDAVRFSAESDDLGRLLASLQPDLVVNCTSFHSPWESARCPSLWTELLRDAGFGLTLPLQAVFAIKFARAIAEHPRPALLINGCYPDAVNPLLKALGLPVFCGVGNIATVASTLRSSLKLASGQRLRVLAHHAHLYAIKSGATEAQAWVDDTPRDNVGSLLAAQRAAHGLELNKVSGSTAAALVKDIVERQDTHTHVPGPLGLPGGYPVQINGDRIKLDLPSSLSESAAIAWNQRVAIADGVRVTAHGEVEFGDQARHALHRHLPQLADGFRAADVENAAQLLLELRARLRTIKPQAALAGEEGKQEFAFPRS